MDKNTEEKLKIENETLALKREHKYTLENLTRVKSDTAEIIATKERITKEINERTEELNKVLLEISTAKLQWINEKQDEINKLAEKEAQAENIIKRKAELNTQEETIRQIESKNTDVLNETRRLELKVQGDQTDIEVRERQLVEVKKLLDEEKKKNEDSMANFKAEILKMIKSVEKI